MRDRGHKESRKPKGWMKPGMRKKEQPVASSISVTLRAHHHEVRTSLRGGATVGELLKACNHVANGGIRVNDTPTSFHHVLNDGDVVEVK